MKTCIVSDETELPRARVLLRLADQHRTAGRFAVAADRYEESAALFEVAGEKVEALSARQQARSLRTGSATSTPPTSPTTTAIDAADGSDLTGQARYAFRLCNPTRR
jgi:hypothetical protein